MSTQKGKVVSYDGVNRTVTLKFDLMPPVAVWEIWNVETEYEMLNDCKKEEELTVIFNHLVSEEVSLRDIRNLAYKLVDTLQKRIDSTDNKIEEVKKKMLETLP